MLGTKFDVEVIAAGESRVFSFADGAAVFRPGDPGNEAYIVKSGRVEMRERGRAVEVLEAGEIFGELALIDDEPRTALAVASGPVELVPIDRATFDTLVHDDEDFAMTIIHLMARSLRATMKTLEACVEDLKTATAPPPRSRASA